MTYEWNFSALDCVIGPDSEGNEDSVYIVHWQFTASEGAYSESEYSSLGVAYTEGQGDFIPFEDLTKSDVQGWCEDGLDVDAMKARLRARIELDKNPINTTLQPPWQNGN